MFQREREKRERVGDKMERKMRNIFFSFVTLDINCFDFIKIAVIFLKSF